MNTSTTTTPAAPDTGEIETHHLAQNTGEAHDSDTRSQVVKVVIGVTPNKLPEWAVYPCGENVLPEKLAQLMFSDLDKLNTFPLVQSVRDHVKFHSPHTLPSIVPFKGVEVTKVGLIDYGNDLVVDSSELSLVLDLHDKDLDVRLANLFSFDIGAVIRWTEGKDCGGGISQTPMFSLMVDPEYRGLRAQSQYNAETDDYTVVLCLSEIAPMFFSTASVKNLLQEDGEFMQRVSKGLFGELGHPEIDNMGVFDKLKRVRVIDQDRVGFQITQVWIDENYGKNNPKCVNPNSVAVMGKIKPIGPKSDIVKQHLLNPIQWGMFCTRGLTDRFQNRDALKTSDLCELVTFDFMAY